MREIKYRGFSISMKKWVYGYYLKDTGNKTFICTELLGSETCCLECGTSANEIYEVYSESFGEYTDLKDKNGKEIYEGDIVKEHNSIGEIIYDCCEFRINWIVNKDFYSDFLGQHYQYLEVIGNIYENPELLPKVKTVPF